MARTTNQLPAAVRRDEYRALGKYIDKLEMREAGVMPNDNDTIDLEAHIKALDLAEKYAEALAAPPDGHGRHCDPATGQVSHVIMGQMWRLIGATASSALIERAMEDYAKKNSGE